ncbi:uncharacterized protein si:dkey-154b15.1 [Pelmatolapia mariae]|uniref:uncharacterized protein si:dkey-154b15.1 n=1 Tax=Pelmatolapia mariae TaxID=158779 RepID=UPI003211CE65
MSEMDFPVEATLHLKEFQDEREVKNIVRSHGFEMHDLGEGRVRVKGHFSKLKEVKAQLEQLPLSQTKMSPSSSSSPIPAASSGAIPKNYSRRDKPPHAALSSPTSSSSSAPGPSRSRPASQGYAAASSPDQRGSLRHREETFVIDADVFKYAGRFRKKEMDSILISHDVKMKTEDCGDMVNITLTGKNSKTALSKVQSLLASLSNTLRTQEVPLQDMSDDGKMLLAKIKKKGNVDGLVLVCEMGDRLHLIGSSRESFLLKQRLLDGRDRHGRTGRASAKGSRGRSNSAPPTNRKSTETAANPDTSPGGATGYSQSKHQDDEQKDATTGWEIDAFHSRPRTRSLSPENKHAKRVNGNPKKRESKPPPQKLKNLFTFTSNGIKNTFKKINRNLKKK